VKLLILAAFSDKYSTLHGLTSGLEECGYLWDQVDTKPASAPVPLNSNAYAEHVAKRAESCDTVLIGKGNTIPMSVYETMIKLCPDTTFLTFDSVSGNGCGPPGRPEELGPRGLLCDRILLTGTEGARWFREQGYKGRIAQIYQGCRHSIWKPGKLPRQNQGRLCFLGSAQYKGDGGRSPKFKAIRNAGFPLRFGRRTFHEDAAEVYWNSAICINLCCGDITSNRLIRVITSGGFMLTEHNKDIEATFENGNQLAWFPFQRGNPHPEMLEQIRYYIDRPALRHEIAMRGYEWSRNWGWAQQAEKMVRFIRGEDVPADGAAGEYIACPENK